MVATDIAAPAATFSFILPDGEQIGAIPIAFDQRALFGMARPPVVVTINGYSYRSTIAIMSGHTFVPLRKSNRDAAGIQPGDSVTVTLTLDTAPREVIVPDDLAHALDAAGVRRGWEAMSFTHQREHAEAIVAAKRPETRDKRIAAAIAAAKAKCGKA